MFPSLNNVFLSILVKSKFFFKKIVLLFICFQRLRKFDHFSRSPRRNTRNYLSPVESRGRSTTLRHFHLSSQGRSVHFRCSNSMEFGRSSSSFSFSLKVKKLLAKNRSMSHSPFSHVFPEPREDSVSQQGALCSVPQTATFTSLSVQCAELERRAAASASLPGGAKDPFLDWEEGLL